MFFFLFYFFLLIYLIKCKIYLFTFILFYFHQKETIFFFGGGFKKSKCMDIYFSSSSSFSSSFFTIDIHKNLILLHIEPIYKDWMIYFPIFVNIELVKLMDYTLEFQIVNLLVLILFEHLLFEKNSMQSII